MSETLFLDDHATIANYEGDTIYQAYMRAKRAGQSSTPFRFTDGSLRYFNVTWDGQTFTRDSFDREPLAAGE